MKIGAIVQARTSSTRLPGKILKDLPFGSGISILQQVIRRLKKTEELDDIIVATTTEEADEQIIRLSEKEGVVWYKGSTDDVLERYYSAAKKFDLDIIVRITSDCPCVDCDVVNLILEEHIHAKADFTSNDLDRTFPYGLDTEVINFDVLEKAHRLSKDPYEREHVCPYIINNPGDFKITSVVAPREFYGPDIRVTIDTEEDYTLLCAVFDYLYPQNEFFGTRDIIKLFDDKPWLKGINKNVAQKRMFDSLQEELEEAVRILELQELRRARELLLKHLK